MCAKSFVLGVVACVSVIVSMGAIGNGDASRERYLESCGGVLAEFRLREATAVDNQLNLDERASNRRIAYHVSQMQKFAP
jgi:hypothetical protein